MKHALLLCTIGLLFIAACNCQKDYHGIVLGQETGLPLAGVTIMTVHYPVKDTADFSMVADSSGRFAFSFGERGNIGCKNLSFYFEKEGYITFITSNTEEMDTVWLEKDEIVPAY